MELRDYVDVARKRWRVVALVTLALVAISALWTMTTPRLYASTTRFFVSTSGDTNAASLQQGNSFTQARVKSYAQLLELPLILDPVIASSGLATTADQLARQVTSTIPLDTVVIEVTVTDRDPAQAQKIARAIGETFPQRIADIEKVRDDQPSPVKVTLVQEALLEPAAISPRPLRNVGLGAFVGLLLGFGAALLRNGLDQRIQTQRDVSAVTEATVIGGIAFDPDATAHPLIVHADPRSPRAESFRSVRTNLQFVDVAHPPRTIVVTSSVAGEGKSTTAANLAFSLAERGVSVVVVEGDLRRPRLLEYLGFEGAVGLTDVLIGRLTLSDTLQQFGGSTLWVLGAGAIPPNPSELLGSTTMQDLIAELRTTFDFVIIDAPPLLPVTDSAVLSTVADGALVVVGANIVTRDQLRHALESLDAVNGTVLGLVLNRVQAKDGGSYGTYSYAYEQHTGRSQAKARQQRASEAAARRPAGAAPTGAAATDRETLTTAAPHS
ncbi:MAG: cell shape-determining protein [Humibacillus sp.]|nr:cell shape-determining protein [Humibacillus sp.]